MLLYARGSLADVLDSEVLREGLYSALDKLGPRRRVIALPPDFTRFHGRAGELTCQARDYYGSYLTDVLPALGTHKPMSDAEIAAMFPGMPAALFRVHDFRHGFETLGIVPGDYIREISEERVDYDWPVQVSKYLARGKHDLILSIGQVVPHEVAGMAGYNKNIFVGTGGSEGINKSHYIGAVYGMERIMGRANNPVRDAFNYGSLNFASRLPILYVLTVVGRGTAGQLVVRGLFIGDDEECFQRASELSLQVNFEMLEQPLHKVVVYLDPAEFRTTWLGNKAIYRTRMAIADGGELIILAPGLKEFGEDAQMDQLIRKYGYNGTPRILAAVKENADLQANLGAAAHLVHGSSEGRFTITYCPGKISREEIEGVGFRYADLKGMAGRYPPEKLQDGWNRTADGERFFYISNPALGLWAVAERFTAK
ncbi:MAG TPA: lactate racemase domain-containing protein [bacterium]|nr:lactate racemase domain-containing protein [bacterium]HPG82563.1 lactate racemase domain-containing protein [bacterium]HPM60290.1 lactate racemase domain-containing protein [bacterium]